MNAIENWLKTTVWGILLLSIIGSLIAYYLIKYSSFLWRWVLPAPWRAFWGSARRAGISEGLAEREMITEGKVMELMTYMVFSATRRLTACVFASVCFLISYHEFNRYGTPKLTWAGYMFFITGVNILQWTNRYLSKITGPYRTLVVPILQKHTPSEPLV